MTRTIHYQRALLEELSGKTLKQLRDRHSHTQALLRTTEGQRAYVLAVECRAFGLEGAIVADWVEAVPPEEGRLAVIETIVATYRLRGDFRPAAQRAAVRAMLLVVYAEEGPRGEQAALPPAGVEAATLRDGQAGDDRHR